METNCIGTPNWIIILVPVILGISALILIIIAIVKIKNRKIIDRY